MRVLILGINYAPEKVGVAVYTAGLAEALAAKGHEVQVIAGRPYYPNWKILPGHNAWTMQRRQEHGVDVTRVPHYIPGQPTALRRVLHHLSFAATSLFPAVWRALSWRPHLVLTIAPALLAAPVGRLAGKMAGAHSWLHVQDFEVGAALAMGLLKPGRAAEFATWFERQVMRSFDTVSSISTQMLNRLTRMGIDPARVVEFRNWADTRHVRAETAPSPYRAEWGITTPHVALYSGNIANKQGIEVLIDGARRLVGRDDLTFVICGEGPHAEQLMAPIKDLPNVQFHNLQPRRRLSDLLSLATVHVLPQRAEASGLVLPSKLNNMLASGRPVVAMTRRDTDLGREVDGVGVLVEPGDGAQLAEAIEKLIDDPELATRLADAARRRSEERWSSEIILDDIERHFMRVVGTDGDAGAEAPVN